MEITAKLLLAKEVQEISPTFSKREVIVETTDSQYPQEIQLEFHGDRTDLIDSSILTLLVSISVTEIPKYFSNSLLSLESWFTIFSLLRILFSKSLKSLERPIVL